MTPPKIIAKGCKFIVKHAPTILTGVGIFGYGASVVLTARATQKSAPIAEQYQKDGDKKKLIRGYLKTWALPVGVFCVSTVSVLSGHKILKGRFIATAGALTATQKAFKAYRSRVVAKEGPEADIQYRYGLTEQTEVVQTEDGDETEKRLSGDIIVDPHDYYIHVFDERNGLYVEGDPSGNIARLRNTLGELNILFDASVDGRMTLKEALNKSGFRYALGEDPDLARFAGRAGWNHREDRGDGYISFGPMFEKLLNDKQFYNNYLMGRTPPLIIEFNCDGDIYA